MLTLFLQTLALLLTAYFVGAWIGCLVRRTFFPIMEEAPIAPYREAAAPAARVETVPAPIRRPDPVRPKIETIDRPAAVQDRFGDALTGPGAGVTQPPRPAPAPVAPVAPVAKAPEVPVVAKPVVAPIAPPPAAVAKAPEVPVVAKPVVAPIAPPPAAVAKAPEVPVVAKPVVAPIAPPQQPVAAQMPTVATPTAPVAKAAVLAATTPELKPHVEPERKPVTPAPREVTMTPPPAVSLPSAATMATMTAAAAATAAEMARTTFTPAPQKPSTDGPQVAPGQTALTASVVAAAAAAVAAANRATQQVKPPETVVAAPKPVPAVAPAPIIAKAPEAPAVQVPKAEPPPTVLAPTPAQARVVMPVAAGAIGQGSVAAEIAHPAVRVTAPSAPMPAAATDDLTKIRAIDQALATRLHGLGVRTYAEIAGWKTVDVARVNAALGFKGRIEQDNWIEQAQILAKGEQTFFSRSTQAPLPPIAKPTESEGDPKPPVPAPAQPVIASKPAVESRAAFAAEQPKAPAPITTVVAQVAKPAAVVAPVAAVVAPVIAAAAAVAPVVVRAAGAAAGRDGLQRIAGINAEVEKLLNVQGVGRYSQIAGWADGDLTRFDRLLGREGRIKSENWVEQAQILARGGETAFSREFDKRVTTPPVQTVVAPVAETPKPTAPAAPGRDQNNEATPPPPAAADAPRPARLVDAIRDTSQRVVGAAQPGRGDLSSLRSVRSEAYRSVETTGPTAIAAAATAGAVAARVGRAAGADDLKRIRGIGVLIEKKLNSMGVTSYQHIAHWTNADVERISTTLDFKGRIERENWIEQARILAEGGQTEFSRRVDIGEVDGKPRA